MLSEIADLRESIATHDKLILKLIDYQQQIAQDIDNTRKFHISLQEKIDKAKAATIKARSDIAELRESITLYYRNRIDLSEMPH